MDNNLNYLSTRNGFNTALRYFKIVNYFISQCKYDNNLADLINNALENGTIKQYQVRLILNVVLVDKFDYYTQSINIKTANNNLKEIAEQAMDWNLFDFNISYYHPQLGEVTINPKNHVSWEIISGGLKENEMIVIYTGNYGREYNKALAEKATEAMIKLLHGEKVEDEKPFKEKSTMGEKTNQPSGKQNGMPSDLSTAANGKASQKKLSPKYGIPVSNELFHNGNVEAWKRIIASYENKYPDIKVLVFYDNEQIYDINTLFKWGKVKHGTMIYISLLGDDFKSISKLRRYLTQGASPRFEDFLKGQPHQILALFKD